MEKVDALVAKAAIGEVLEISEQRGAAQVRRQASKEFGAIAGPWRKVVRQTVAALRAAAADLERVEPPDNLSLGAAVDLPAEPAPQPARPEPPRIERAVRPGVPAGERAILTACAQYPHGADRKQISILTSYKRSTRDAYIQRLREKGYVDDSGSLVQATPEGLVALGPDFEPLPTGEALQDYWLARLPEGERKILDALIQAYPQTLEREALSGHTGYKRSTRDAYIKRLDARQLVEIVGRGEVRASAVLFE
jgi:DNA-binding MarR family transcriptional regulator